MCYVQVLLLVMSSDREFFNKESNEPSTGGNVRFWFGEIASKFI